jgi:hypothetical protein
MNDLPDPLEAELSSLIPCELSAQSRFRIAKRLNSPAPAFGGGGKSINRRRLFRQLAFAGGLAAACLLAIFLWWQGRQPDDPGPEALVNPKSIPMEAEPRTLLAYHHALSSSAENLDAEFSTFAWPLPETTPNRIATAIPRDLLD